MDSPEVAGRITITTARYRGAYEGGRWVAFWAAPHEVPEDPFDEDNIAAVWWVDEAQLVGRGETPNEALADLFARWRSRRPGQG